MKLNENIAISDSGFIFNPTTGDSFSVNPVGHSILILLQSGKSSEEILKSLTDEFFIDDATAEKDYEDFVRMLSSYRLIKDLDNE